MAKRYFTSIERQKLNEFPKEISNEDIITFFTLSEEDLKITKKRRKPHNQLGFAIQLCSLRYLGFSPDEFSSVPFRVVKHVAKQLDVLPNHLSNYGKRETTRREHLKEVQNYLGVRDMTKIDSKHLTQWLMKRAMEHNKPMLLYQTITEQLRREKIIRPGITILESMIINSRQKAQREIYTSLDIFLTEELKGFLDKILIPNEELGKSFFSWLRQGATSNTPDAILETIRKLDFLQNSGIHNWDLSNINPNKRKFLSQQARKSTNQILQRINPPRRYPMLLSFLKQSLEDITDELIELYDNCLSTYYSRAKKDLRDFQLFISKNTNENLRIFQDIGQIILDPQVSNRKLRETIFKKIPEETLSDAVEKCDEIIRPVDDKAYDFFAKRYGQMRRFAPIFLETLVLHSYNPQDPLLKAIALLKELNRTEKRDIPEKAPMSFIPNSWLPYMEDKDGYISRKYYEVCLLWQLRNAFRSGNIWVENSRKYANPESYLIPKERWGDLKDEYCRAIGLSEKVETRLEKMKGELEKLLVKVDKKIPNYKDVKIENEKLKITPFEAVSIPESVKKLRKLITERLPRVELVELLIEVDYWTKFTDCFEHAGGYKSRNKDLATYIYASIIAQSCNFELKRMAEIADLSHEKLIWCNNWYFREDILQKAINKLVDYHYNQPLSKYWGSGTLSSSDGQNIPVSVKTKNATALPKYFGYGKGLTFYSWTSDQFSQYGSKVITATVRDATHVLDAILDNETELEIFEHTTDTAGYTDLVFALFDLLGMQFSPRIRDLGDQVLYYFDSKNKYKHLKSILTGKIKPDIIIENWDNILRTATSINFGWVTASLFISKLQAYPQKNILTKALQEYGRIVKTIFILKYIDSEDYRRKIGIQLNKGEALHALRLFLFFANQSAIRKSQIEAQINQASCLTLLTNAVMIWNTRYMEAVIDQLELEGYLTDYEDLLHISPARYEHINKYGKYNFNIEKELKKGGLRPLRNPKFS